MSHFLYPNAHVIGFPLGEGPGHGWGLCKKQHAMYIYLPVHEGNDSNQSQNISLAFSEKKATKPLPNNHIQVFRAAFILTTKFQVLFLRNSNVLCDRKVAYSINKAVSMWNKIHSSNCLIILPRLQKHTHKSHETTSHIHHIVS